MKKIISAIIIICIIIIGFIAYKSMAKPTVKANAATLMNNSNSSNVQNNTSTSNNSASGTNTANNTGNTSSTNTTTTNAQSQNENASSASNASNTTNASTSTNTTSTSTSTTNRSNQIIYNNNLSSNYSLKTIVVKNSTGKNISNSDLAAFIRNWILEGQYKNPVIPTDMGTEWSEPWLDKISNNTIVQAFINANGTKSLSQDITVNEFVKATNKLNQMTINNVPFALKEAKELIIKMLQKNGYASPNEITKIIYVPGTPGIYNVYTKNSNNNIFWTVAANTGSGKA